jgi:hypothetical protein
LFYPAVTVCGSLPCPPYETQNIWNALFALNSKYV